MLFYYMILYLICLSTCATGLGPEITPEFDLNKAKTLRMKQHKSSSNKLF